MTANKKNILCGKVVKGSALRKDPADKDMVLFNVRLLPGRLRITEENSGSPAPVEGVFNAERIFELNTVVCKNDLEQTAKGFSSELVVKDIKYSQNAFLRTVRHKEDQHKVGLSENESQKDFPTASGAFYGVHFYYLFIGMLGSILFEIVILSAFSVFVVHTGKNMLLSALTVSDLLR